MGENKTITNSKISQTIIETQDPVEIQKPDFMVENLQSKHDTNSVIGPIVTEMERDKDTSNKSRDPIYTTNGNKGEGVCANLCNRKQHIKHLEIFE